MDANEMLAQFTIPTPCPMDWERMRGDDRVRFCEGCGKHVYNLVAMSPDERASITSTIRSDGEDLCGRLYQRPDGTLIASECRPVLQGSSGPWQFTIRSLMTVIAACGTVFGITKLWLGSPELPKPNPPFSKYSLPIMGKMMRRPAAVTPTINAPSCTAPESSAPPVDG